ncbi:MAG: prepilin-type N-terminal cleavage/methylation domain-containing protein, partial [Candidatus Omnitrophica bacterium]|nr:prepilin-type N-terminal cleavage/methylation domain-containing protein [Candidatus Omnitrophota bacterium]
MKRRFDLQQGFTMVEMMVSTITFLILMGMAFQTLLAANAVRQAAVARVDIYQNARSTLDVITRELRNATLRETDIQFTETEVRSRNLGNLRNPRGRMILNDWPPYDSNYDSRDLRVYRGDQVDNDKDGRTDEEAFDGVDNDGDGETNSPVSQHVPVRGQAMADGLDNDINGLVDEGIDEDIFFPRDMINFQSLLDSGSGADLVEIGYAIDVRTGRDLLRRSAYRDLNNQRQGLPQVNGQNEVDGIYPISLQYNLGEEVPYPGVGDSNGAKVPWFDPENPQSGVTLDG